MGAEGMLCNTACLACVSVAVGDVGLTVCVRALLRRKSCAAAATGWASLGDGALPLTVNATPCVGPSCTG